MVNEDSHIKEPCIKIGNHKIGKNRPVFIIAEIGVNHNGDVNIAKKLIDAAKDAGASAVKFQKRHLESTYQKSLVSDPNKYGQSFQYLIPLLKDFEFFEKDYKELVSYCAQRKIIFLCTPFDEPSVDFLEKFKVSAYKVASADLINLVLLERLAEKKKPLILSVGMATEEEISFAVDFLENKKTDFALLHCQSTYPAPLDMINLRYISRLGNLYNVPIGYSGHEQGYLPTLAAISLGALIIERHITLDKNMEGPDHPASLEPEEFKKMVSSIRDIEISLGGSQKFISRGEVVNKESLRKSLVAAINIPKNATIRRDMLTAKGPGRGLSPMYLYDLLGKKAGRPFKKDELFFESDLFEEKETALDICKTKGSWGVKTRFHELNDVLTHFPNASFVEFHLSDKDLDFSFDKNISRAQFNYELFFHSPEYWGRKVVDLCSLEDDLWNQSIEVVQKTINKAREISLLFKGSSGGKTGRPVIVLHMGGMSLSSVKNRAKLLDRAKRAFEKLDRKGVDILPENMPPFGWFFGGSWHINAFVDCEDVINFCKEFGLNMCFDFSHAWLACNFLNYDYLSYIEKCLPYVKHMHIADAKGVSGEGLQIEEGEIPFDRVFKFFDNKPKLAKARWLPEIWNGHLCANQGFKEAFDKLSKYKFLRR